MGSGDGPLMDRVVVEEEERARWPCAVLVFVYGRMINARDGLLRRPAVDGWVGGGYWYCDFIQL